MLSVCGFSSIIACICVVSISLAVAGIAEGYARGSLALYSYVSMPRRKNGISDVSLIT